MSKQNRIQIAGKDKTEKGKFTTFCLPKFCSAANFGCINLLIRSYD